MEGRFFIEIVAEEQVIVEVAGVHNTKTSAPIYEVNKQNIICQLHSELMIILSVLISSQK